MCHLVRNPQALAGEEPGASVPPRPHGLRPRWAAAIAAVFVGGVALAAWVSPPAPTSVPAFKRTVARAPSTSFAPAPTATDVERGTLPVDDAVPTTTGAKTSDDCNHEL